VIGRHDTGDLRFKSLNGAAARHLAATEASTTFNLGTSPASMTHQAWTTPSRQEEIGWQRATATMGLQESGNITCRLRSQDEYGTVPPAEVRQSGPAPWRVCGLFFFTACGVTLKQVALYFDLSLIHCLL
jgi:hypothetical protein